MADKIDTTPEAVTKLLRENENLRQIERNVQAVREHEYKRAETALAEVERLKAERDEAIEGWHVIHPNITVQDAAMVPEIKALIEAAKALHIDMLERAKCRMDTISGEQYRIVNSGRSAWANFDAALRAITEGTD